MAALAVALLLGTTGRAATVVTLGEQDFSDGQLIDFATYETASVGEQPPFEEFRGFDGTENFTASWVFSFAPLAINDAAITLGLFDHDSAAPGTQVATFTLNNFDLTGLLNDAFESRGGTQGENNIYSLVIPQAALSSLAGGIATFTLTLQGPALRGANRHRP